MGENRVTIDDVALAAGVSRQTVSRAINNLSGISAVTRERILQLAKDMGYRPSNIARGLANAEQRTYTLGVIVPTIDNEFYAAVLHGIEEYSSVHGYNVFICDTDEDPRTEYRKIQSLLGLWIDGLILCASRMDDEQLSEVAQQIRPLILLNREFHHPNAGNVMIDDQQGTAEAVQHLLALGHTHIGILLGLPVSRSSQNRFLGYQTAMKKAGCHFAPEWVRHTDASLANTTELAKQYLQANTEISALVVYNDVRAAGVLRACAELNIQVPQQLAVVSHDNISLSSLLIPSLSTVDIPKVEMGRQGMLMMMGMLNEKEYQPNIVRLSPHLIVRESSQTR